MHAHILTNVCNQKQGECDKHTMPHMRTHVSIKLYMGHEADMANQVDITTCTDACTHSNQGVGTEIE